MNLNYYSLFCIGIGQPLSMLLKLNPAVTKLNLYDIVHTPGVASDLSHCETASTSTGFVGMFLFPIVIFTESYVVLASIYYLPHLIYPFNMGHFFIYRRWTAERFSCWCRNSRHTSRCTEKTRNDKRWPLQHKRINCSKTSYGKS